MSGHLTSIRTWLVQCAWCSRYAQIELDEKRQVIEKALRDEGWRKTRKHGWACSADCSHNLKQKRGST